MAEYKEFSGVIYENNTKISDNSPSFRGHLIDQDTKYSLSAWDRFSDGELNQLNRGFLIENTNRLTEKHPDLIGKIITTKGQHLYIGAWKRVSSNSVNYYSISLKQWDNQFNTDQLKVKFSLACKEWKEKQSP